MRVVVLLSILFFSGNSLSIAFYEAFKSDSIEVISKELNLLELQKETSLTKAYRGALLMKKSSSLSSLKEKLDLFKIGHSLLEKEISTNPSNVEYRFLRLVIQEKAPRILKYNVNIDEDKSLIIKGFSQLPTNVKQFVRDYCLTSSVLKSADLKG